MGDFKGKILILPIFLYQLFCSLMKNLYFCSRLMAFKSVEADRVQTISFLRKLLDMEQIKLLDVKKALRLCGWELVKVDGNKSLYRHADVPEGLVLVGRGYDVVSSDLLLIVEQRLGLCLRVVLA